VYKEENKEENKGERNMEIYIPRVKAYLCKSTPKKRNT
jgi:hypothetical protein